MTFTATVFIGTSLDGYIARPDDDIEWLTSRGERAGDISFFECLDSVDAVIMGRDTYDKVIGFGEEKWHYGERHVGVLSTTLPENADPRITVYRDVNSLVTDLDERGIKHVCPDGGRLIQSFIRAGRVDGFIISVAPVLIGAGHPLFGELSKDVSFAWTRPPTSANPQPQRRRQRTLQERETRHRQPQTPAGPRPGHPGTSPRGHAHDRQPDRPGNLASGTRRPGRTHHRRLRRERPSATTHRLRRKARLADGAPAATAHRLTELSRNDTTSPKHADHHDWRASPCPDTGERTMHARHTPAAPARRPPDEPGNGKIPPDRDDGTGSREPPTRSLVNGPEVDLWGFEPQTPSMRTRCATGLRYRPSQRKKP